MCRSLVFVFVYIFLTFPLFALAQGDHAYVRRTENAMSFAKLPRAVRIIWSSDTRGMLLPLIVSGEERAGLALRKSHMERLKKGRISLLVSPGDYLFPGHLGVLDEGRTLIDCYGMIGYDAVGVGTSDLELGMKVLRARASQAKFPIIASNIINKGKTFSPMVSRMSRPPLSGTTFPLCPAYLLDKGDISIGLVAVVNQDVVTMHSGLSDEIEIVEPRKAIEAIAPLLRKQGADVIIALSSAGFQEAINLASVDEVDLVIRTRGRLRDPNLRKLHDCRLAGGKAILSLPFGGMHVGRAPLKMRPHGVTLGPAHLVEIEPVGKEILPDEKMRKIIEGLDMRLIENYSRQVTRLSTEAAKNFREVCAEVARERLDTEVALVNKGFFQERTVPGPLRLIDLRRCIPFGDTLARVQITGGALEDLLNSRGEELVHAGLAKREGKWTVNGRLLERSVTYSLATVSFIARGGGKYMAKDNKGLTKEIFREIVEKRLAQFELVTAKTFRYLWRKPINVFKTSFLTAASRININDNVEQYRDNAVPGLATASSTKLRGAFDFNWRHDRPRSDTVTSVRGKYEELERERTLDQLIIGLLHERKLNLSGKRPFISMELDTTLTANSLNDEDRPYKFKLGAGHTYQLSNFSKFRLGISSLHLFGSLEDDTTFGTDATFEYLRDHAKRGITVATKINHFYSYSGLQVNQLKWENAINIKLIERLRLAIRFDSFLYSTDDIGSTARSSEFYFGIAYDLARRRF